MLDPQTLSTALLAAVPEDGSSIGNQALQDQLKTQFAGLTEAQFMAARDALIEAGQLRKGRGRGGSVLRADGVGLNTENKAPETKPAAQPAAKGKRGKQAQEVAPAESGIDSIKRTLWASADKLRANMDAAEYKHIVLGLIFIKYVSDTFQARRKELERRFADERDDYYLHDADADFLAEELEERDYYREVNVFWVPEGARWEALRASAKQADIGKRIDDALVLIEQENPRLKSILDKRFARAQLPDGKLGELVDLVSTIGFGDEPGAARDVLGQVYEYFLGEFANAEGKKGGQFYTPASIVQTLVAVLAPHHGQVYDPCCGSGGMFVQSERFIESHGGKLGDVSIYGQESNPTTWRLAAMNLAIRGMDYNLGKEPGDTFTRNQHPDLRADFVLANPPFNISDWWHGSLDGDPRWVYGTPPAGNANYAWLQHMLYHLKPGGRAGIVLANGSMSSSQSGEGEIRARMVEADVVECMVALPGQLFFNTQIPACLWFLAKSKRSRPGEVLFIDARKLGTMVSRVQCELDGLAIARIADTFHAWKSDGETAQPYEDVPGFCRSVPLAEIAEHGHVLTPGRYVGAEEVEEDDEAFADKMQKLIEKLGEQMAKGAELDQLIRQKLGGLGYEF
ncbi:TPA: SAM-dependent DNA methyltransferase [Aeromonas hydrophila]|uniref:class I SAM-dependent DNA methyltransferase n=1 Tax=Aeromonas caviae TaxID=648 RepID=UPI001A1D05FB|nr:SAM-dependent DNA methyltransferase [Aeromonas hydrophila]HAT2382314.1 SAM-dependent DNA methyltransferase [Aeromonas hydrophila]HAT2415059.1 SAM-dependent DNA methyltransferase [Aeromonas hydrophila]HAT2525395.1 SAM-dependent DNA methyltransferase [Aeromonas hydrophila]HAT2545365.1 SAM-dependent DNA methyltransferase [Aeromonas hydrophila]